MALLGPVGSGKTALVSAAAQELGFRVLEVNPSMERTAGQVGDAVDRELSVCSVKELTLFSFSQASGFRVQGWHAAACCMPQRAVGWALLLESWFC